ncbi:MAG: hypothetical protein INQ03_23265 [Candidatus Heimdallarchaeota archaeon]|nr:hypothetical protein [Candidatus Heimdallarchaeota archaeon]
MQEQKVFVAAAEEPKSKGRGSPVPSKLDPVTSQKSQKSKVPAETINSSSKMNIIIQIPKKNAELRVRVPENTSLADIKQYIARKYILGNDNVNIQLINNENLVKSPNLANQSEKVGVIIKPSLGEKITEMKIKIDKDTKIKKLKIALAKKYNLDESDFELIHYSKNSEN